MSTNRPRKRPIQAHPLTQSLQPLGAVAAVLTALGISLASIGAGAGAVEFWSRLDDLGREVLNDASWLLPALLSANLGLAALLFAQTVTHADAKLIATTRHVVTIGSVFIGAGSAAVAALSATALIRDPGTGVRLFAVLLLASVICGISVWLSLLFFGTPDSQLAVAQELHAANQAILDRLGTAGTVPAGQVWAANVGITALISLLVFFSSAAAFDQANASRLTGAVLVAVAAMTATTLTYLAELGVAEWLRKRGLVLLRALLTIALFGPVLLAVVTLARGGIWGVGLGVVAAVSMPLLSAWWRPGRGWLSGWTLRAAVIAKTSERLIKRRENLQAYINDLRQRQTRLVLK